MIPCQGKAGDEKRDYNPGDHMGDLPCECQVKRNTTGGNQSHSANTPSLRYSLSRSQSVRERIVIVNPFLVIVWDFESVKINP